MNTGRRSVYVLLLAALLALGIAGVARADTFAVNSFADDDNVTQCQNHAADCTLRGAIHAANAVSTDDTVTLPTGRYDFGVVGTELEVANQGSLTINGQTGDAKDVIVSAEGLARVMLIDSGANVAINGVTLQDGYADADGGGIFMGCGAQDKACIASVTVVPTQLTLDHARVLKNTSTSCGGGIYGEAVSQITLRSSNVDRNSAGGCGGGIFNRGVGSKLSMFDSSVDGNAAADDTGGGIDAEADVPAIIHSGPRDAISTPNEVLHAERSSISHNQAT